ncbi:MAG: hypothetical protein ACE5KX_05215, partial [Acidimicrobiia bacterium]
MQDKIWVQGPDDARWEVYTVLGDSPVGVREGPKAGADELGRLPGSQRQGTATTQLSGPGTSGT